MDRSGIAVAAAGIVLTVTAIAMHNANSQPWTNPVPIPPTAGTYYPPPREITPGPDGTTPPVWTGSATDDDDAPGSTRFNCAHIETDPQTGEPRIVYRRQRFDCQYDE